MSASPGLLAAIERGAREQGIWWGSPEDAIPGLTTISFDAIAGLYRIRRWTLDSIERAASFAEGTIEANALTASVYVMLAGLTVERPCPDCEARGGGWEWHQETSTWNTLGEPDNYSGGGLRIAGWTTSFHEERRSTYDGMEFVHGMLMACRPCPACSVEGKPTGRVHVEARRRLLDVIPVRREKTYPTLGAGIEAASAISEADFEYRSGSTVVWWERDYEARADMLVLADDRQQRGDPRGGVLALWLAGELREEHVLGFGELRPARVGVASSLAASKVLAERWLTHGTHSAFVDFKTRPRSADIEQEVEGGAWAVTFRVADHTLEARPT